MSSSSSSRFSALDIARENDFLRQHMHVFCLYPAGRWRVVVTRAVAKHPKCGRIFSAIQDFDGFSPENDPYNEHDFGAVVVDGETFFFKIDYYNRDYSAGVDPYKVVPHRVLTIMHQDDY